MDEDGIDAFLVYAAIGFYDRSGVLGNAGGAQPRAVAVERDKANGKLLRVYARFADIIGNAPKYSIPEMRQISVSFFGA